MSSSSASPDDNPCPKREKLPLKDALYSSPGKDRAFYENLLSKNQSRLFEAGKFKFEVLCLLHNNEGKWLSHEDKVEGHSTTNMASKHRIVPLLK